MKRGTLALLAAGVLAAMLCGPNGILGDSPASQSAASRPRPSATSWAVEIELQNGWNRHEGKLLAINPTYPSKGRPSIKSIYESASTQPVDLLKPEPIALVAQLNDSYNNGDELIPMFTRRGNQVGIYIEYVRGPYDQDHPPQETTAYAYALFPEPLPPGRYFAGLYLGEMERDSNGDLHRSPNLAIRQFEHLTKILRVVGPDGKLPPDNTLLPGTRLSIEKTIGGGFLFAALCQSSGNDDFISIGQNEYETWDDARITDVVAGDAKVGDMVTLRYVWWNDIYRGQERPVDRGEKVIWIVRYGFSGDQLQGVMALPDTPENRKAIIAAAAKVRTQTRPASKPS